MARTLTPRDAHALVNLVMAELTGQDASIQQVTTDNFVSVGETILTQYPMENVYNARIFYHSLSIYSSLI